MFGVVHAPPCAAGSGPALSISPEPIGDVDCDSFDVTGERAQQVAETPGVKALFLGEWRIG
jgi:hypothetical protein